MKSLHLVIICMVFSLLIPTYIDSTYAEDSIPSWIRATAQYWADGTISDQEFVLALEYLTNNQIIRVPNNGVDEKYLEEYKTWANNEIQKQKDYAQILLNENQNLKSQILTLEKTLDNYVDSVDTYRDEVNRYVDEVEEYHQQIDQQSKKPQTKITHEKVEIRLFDSKGNQYDWVLPIETYETYVQHTYHPTQTIQYPDGRTQTVGEFSSYVQGSFKDVIDDIYENSLNEDDFIYEIWFITSQLTIYSTDIEEDPRFAIETLVRGGGDCEDTAILIADMIRSSSYTTDWDVNLLYFDSDNPENPIQVNHVSLEVDTGKNSYSIESTAKTIEGVNSWLGTSIMGWRTPI